MKTTTTEKSIFMAAAMILGICAVSCSNDDEPVYTDSGSDTSQSATVTFTYKVPPELFDYAEITVAYNNDEGTDALSEPMLSDTFTVTYNLDHFPVTAPVVFIYEYTNRPSAGIDVDWTLDMEEEATVTTGGESHTVTNHETYTMEGDLSAAIKKLQANVTDRTYGARIDKDGNVKFVH